MINKRTDAWNTDVNVLSLYLAFINRAGGLYGRILTEVVSTNRTQWGLYSRGHDSPIQGRLSSVNKKFIIWQHEQFISFNLTGLY